MPLSCGVACGKLIAASASNTEVNVAKISLAAFSVCVGSGLLFQPAFSDTIMGNLLFGTTLLGTYTLVDELASSTLTVVGFAVSPIPTTPPINEYATPLNIGKNWEYKLVFSFRAVGPEFVGVGGSVQHLIPPPDAPTHQAANPFSVNMTFNAQPPGIVNNPPLKFENHPPHKDLYTQDISGQKIGQEISQWTAIIVGRHVPEPSQILLTSAGLFLLVASRLRLRTRRN
jgi:hypothetical protein